MNLSQPCPSTLPYNLSRDVITADQSQDLLTSRDIADFLAICLIFAVCLTKYSRVLRKFSLDIKVTRDVGCQTDDWVDNNRKNDQRIPDSTSTNTISDNNSINSSDPDSSKDFSETENVCKNCEYMLQTEITAGSNSSDINPPNYYDTEVINTEIVTATESRYFLDESIERQSLFFERVEELLESTDITPPSTLYERSSLLRPRRDFVRKRRSRIPVLLDLKKRMKCSIVSRKKILMSSPTKIMREEESFELSIHDFPNKPMRPSSSTPESLKNFSTDSKSPDTDRPDSANMTFSPKFTERYRYCDSMIRHGVLLRSPEHEAVGKSISSTTSYYVDKRNCNSQISSRNTLDNFVFSPRIRYGTNRKLYRISYNCS